LLNDPLAKTCYIPGVKWQVNAVDVIGDQISGKNGDQIFSQMLTIIKLASESNRYPLNSIAQDWINARVDEYAEYFCDDLVEEMKEDKE